MAEDWTRAEVEATVADFLAMYFAWLSNQDVNKTEQRRRLMPLLNNRSEASIEWKRRNISAVLVDMGLPPLQGYLPAFNYQDLLWDVVEAHIAALPTLTPLVEADVLRPVSVPTETDILRSLVDPPKPTELRPTYTAERRVRAPRKNFLALEAALLALGHAGEEFALRYERASLAAAGREDLAAKVERVSLTDEAAGYDILSFEPSSKERFIEVKTTKYGPSVPFYVTRNELVTSRSEADRYHLYRVYDFRRQPLFYRKRGRLDQGFFLDPVNYEARIA